MTVVASRTHADGVKAALAATGRPVGDGVAPDGALPYCVAYDIAGGSLDGPVSDPDADVEWPFQVTCVGSTAEQARWMADKVRDALQTVSVAGRVVVRVIPDGMPGLQRDDDTAGSPLFYLTPRWRLWTTPV